MMTEEETRRFAEAMTNKIRQGYGVGSPRSLYEIALQVVVDTDLLLDPANDLTIADWEIPTTVITQLEALEADRRPLPMPPPAKRRRFRMWEP